MSSRGYVFTINNYTEEDEKCVLNLSEKARYIIAGKEVGDSGTPHIQGYVYFRHERSRSAVKKDLPRAWFEKAMGTPEDNKKYCSKDRDILIEDGEPPISRKRKGELGGSAQVEKYQRAWDLSKEGRFEEVDASIRFRYMSTMLKIHKHYMPKIGDADDVTGVWIHGKAGAGKSRKAREDYPDSYFKLCNKWWDGYRDEKTVIIDDFDENHRVLGHHLKIWADRYEFIAEIKGGALKIRPEKIVVTSQYTIEQIWPDDETRDALNRRFTSVHVEREY